MTESSQDDYYPNDASTGSEDGDSDTDVADPARSITSSKGGTQPIPVRGRSPRKHGLEPSSPSHQRKRRKRKSAGRKFGSGWIFSRKHGRIELPSGQEVAPTHLLTNAYRDLLNETITGVRDGSQSPSEGEFEPTHNGCSFWTEREKLALHTQLKRCGSDNLRALSTAIGTKSASEVRLYIDLLKQKESESRPRTQRRPAGFPGIPIALEVSKQCEQVLEAAADLLAEHIHQHDIDLERARFGGDWLIDVNLAQTIDRNYEKARDIAEQARDGSSADDGQDQVDDKLLELESAEFSAVTAEELMIPSVLLTLSRTLFMNDAEIGSWYDIEPTDGAADGPAIFRSAFNLLFEDVKNFTRHLLLTSYFQTQSRYRASSHESYAQTGETIMTPDDVFFARETLNAKVDFYSYWATVPRRMNVSVYTRAKKYDDGRPFEDYGPVAGYRLSPGEVEAELGLIDHPACRAALANEADNVLRDSEVDRAINDSDICTETDTDIGQPGSVSPERKRQRVSHAEEEDMPYKEAQRYRAKQLRHRRIAEFLRQETRYLEEADCAASASEELQLWQLLRVNPPSAAFDQEQSVLHNECPKNIPLEISDQVNTWRDEVQYAAPWEEMAEPVDPTRFDAMAIRGRMTARKRNLFRQAIAEKLASSENASLASDSAKSDSSRNSSESPASGEEGHGTASASTSNDTGALSSSASP